MSVQGPGPRTRPWFAAPVRWFLADWPPVVWFLIGVVAVLPSHRPFLWYLPWWVRLIVGIGNFAIAITEARSGSWFRAEGSHGSTKE